MVNQFNKTDMKELSEIIKNNYENIEFKSSEEIVDNFVNSKNKDYVNINALFEFINEQQQGRVSGPPQFQIKIHGMLGNMMVANFSIKSNETGVIGEFRVKYFEEFFRKRKVKEILLTSSTEKHYDKNSSIWYTPQTT